MYMFVTHMSVDVHAYVQEFGAGSWLIYVESTDPLSLES